jgi:hypothetical protein
MPVAKPFPQSFWFHERLLCAGCYPGDRLPAERDKKLRGLLECGLVRILNLMEPTEKSRGGKPFEPYVPRLQELAGERGISVECLCLPIKDALVPSLAVMQQILATVDESLEKRVHTYVHCWGAHGRTSTVVACHLIRRGRSPAQAIELIRQWHADLPKSHDPCEGGQKQFVLSWADHDATPVRQQP